MSEGIIIKINSGIYTVKSGTDLITCSLRGKFRIDGITPYVGDKCVVSNDVITDILPRKNFMIRPRLANIDMLLVVFSASNPKPQLDIIDKITVMAELKNITPVIVITKSDLSDDETVEFYKNIYDLTGYKVIVTASNENNDIDSFLEKELRGGLAAVAGCSGVGKSTLLNKLLGDGTLKTGEISSKSKRGRHTTTCIQLFERYGGFVADTPGFTSFEVGEIKQDEIENYFPEIRSRLGKCRFKGCSHINEPDCPVKDALEKGEFAKSRYDSYVKIYNDLKPTY